MAPTFARRALPFVVAISTAACSGSPAQPGLLPPSDPPMIASVEAADVTYSLTVFLVGTGSGTVVSDPAGISCSRSRCRGMFVQGTFVTLTATPSRTSEFAGWTDACLAAGSSPTATVTMDASKYCTASFTTKGGPATPTGGPDLIASLAYVPSRLTAGAGYCPATITTNQGDRPAGQSTTRVLFSSDATFDPGVDTPLWSAEVPALPAGATDRQIGDEHGAWCFRAPTTRGTYYYLAVADVEGAVTEVNETNNVRVYKVSVR